MYLYLYLCLFKWCLMFIMSLQYKKCEIFLWYYSSSDTASSSLNVYKARRVWNISYHRNIFTMSEQWLSWWRWWRVTCSDKLSLLIVGRGREIRPEREYFSLIIFSSFQHPLWQNKWEEEEEQWIYLQWNINIIGALFLVCSVK